MFKWASIKKETSGRVYRLLLTLLISYSVLLLIILLQFFSAFNSTVESGRLSYNLQAQTAMSGRIDQFEMNLRILDTQCRQVLQASEFRRIMNQSEVTDAFLSDGYSLSNDLAVNIYSDSLLPVKEVYYYLPRSGYVLGPSYFLPQSNFYDWIKKYPKVLEANWWDLLSNPDSCNKLLPFGEFQPGSGQNYYLYIINMDDVFYREADARAIFVIRKDEFHRTFGVNEDMPYYLSIYDSNVGEFVLEENTTSLDITDKLDALKFSNDFHDFNNVLEHEEICIGRYESENGYIYYYSFPSFGAENNNFYRIKFALYSFLLVIIATFAVLWLSSRSLKPVIELDKELEQSIETQEELKGLIDKQKPIIMRSHVRRLLATGVNSEDEVEYIRNYLSIPPSAKYFKSMYIVVYDSSTLGELLSTENEGIASDILNIIISSLEEKLGAPLLYFLPNGHSLSVLLAYDESEHKDYLLKLQNAIYQLHNSLLENHNLWLFAGVGKTTQNIMNVWESHEQATEASTYTSKNYIFLPYEYIKKDSNTFYYPQEFSNKLIHFITNGNKDQAMELLRLIHKENIEERALPVNVLQFLLSDIRNTLLKARFELPSSIEADNKKELDALFEEKLSFTTCEDITSLLTELFVQKTGDGELIENIVDYIKENYADSLMCLNKISDEFGISETYFSHMFKQKTGENFSSYLENMRMAKALELIKGADVPLNDVYAMVGYNNQNSFRRAFKKVYGTTPGSIQNK